MTLPRFDLLANLVRSDGQTLASLSRSMLVTAGNLTGLVDRAARDGMVERRADPSDRRAWRVHLTAKGQRAFRDAERRHAARVAKVFSGLSPAELSTLTRLLDKLRTTLREPDMPVPSRPGSARAHAERSARSPRGARGRSPDRARLAPDAHRTQEIPMTLAPRSFQLEIRRGVADDHAEPARPPERPHLRGLRRAHGDVPLARALGRARVVLTGSGARLLLGRRRRGDHRRAVRARRAGPARVHPRDRRADPEHPRAAPPGHRRRQRRRRRRGRGDRRRLRPAHRRGERPLRLHLPQGRPVRRRHGRLVPPAAHRRPRARRRAALLRRPHRRRRGASASAS